jgi:hypothetical protein
MHNHDFVQRIISSHDVLKDFKKLKEIKPFARMNSLIDQQIKALAITVFHNHIKVLL